MTLELALPTAVEERLRCEARRRGQPEESVAVQILDQHLPPTSRTAAAIEMLRQWAEEDEAMSEEEEASNAAVLRALDEDRPSYRKLFPQLAQDSPK